MKIHQTASSHQQKSEKLEREKLIAMRQCFPVVLSIISIHSHALRPQTD